MNSLRKSVSAVVVRFQSRTTDRPSRARPRRFRPLAEPMEGRALLSQVALTGAIAGPVAGDIVVNGQTEPQPGDIVVNGQTEPQPGDIAASGLSPHHPTR